MKLSLRTFLMPLLALAFVVSSSVVVAQSTVYSDAGYANPTVTSDKDDYAPGEIAHITGSGWSLDQQVHVEFKETPDYPDYHIYDVAVDADGNWKIDYQVEERHLGVKFTVTSDGKQSGYRGIHVFTDAQNTVTTLVSSINPSFVGQNTTFTMSVVRDGQVNSNTNKVIGTLKLYIDDPQTSPNLPTTTAVQTFLIIEGSNSNKTYSISSLAVGNHKIRAIFTGDPTSPGYNNSEASITQIVNTKLNPVITWNNPANIIYSAALGSTQLNATASVAGTFAYSPAFGTVLNAGTNQTLSVTFTPTDGVTYNTATKSVDINVLQKPVVITPTANQSKTFGTADPVFSFSNNSSLPLSFFTGALSREAGTDVGNYAYTLGNLSAGANYSLSLSTLTPVAKFQIIKADQVISWTPPPAITYGTALSATQLNATTSGDGTLTYTPVSGTVLSAGIQILKVDAAETSNYNAAHKEVSLTVNQASNTITFTNPGTKTYGDADFNLIASATSGGTVSFEVTSGNATVTSNVLHITGAGSVSVKATQAGNLNYQAADAVSQTFTVNKAIATISFSGLTPTYNGAPKAVTAATNPAGVSGVAITYDDSATAPTNAGSYAVSATLENVNYKLASGNDPATASLIIAKAANSISFAALETKTYGDADFTINASSTSSLPVIYTATGNASVTGNTVHITGAGSATITAHQAGTTNYEGAADVAQSFIVSARHITGTFAADNKTYDGNAYAVITTRHLTGIVGSDDVTLTGGTALFADKNVGTGKTVTASGIALSGTAAANYILASVATTTANITEKSLTISITADAKTYDGTTGAEVHASIGTGLVDGDNVSAGATNGTFDTKHVGTYKTVTASVSATGSDAANYSVNTTATATADITAKPITVTITADNKTYDGTTFSNVHAALGTGLVLGDVIVPAAANGAFADKNVAIGKPVTANVSISGTDAGNYSLTEPTSSTTANITALTITGSITASNKVYDGTPAATITSRTLTGTVSGDEVILTGGTALFEDKNAGQGKSVLATSLSLTGTDAPNYHLSETTALTTANITALSIVGSITAADKIYNGTEDAEIITRTLAGILLNDDVTYTGGSASFNTKTVGSNKPVTANGLYLTGADAANYTVNNEAATTATITAKALTVSITASDKTYDGTATAATAASIANGLVAGDVVVPASINGAFDTKHAGSGKTVTADISISGSDAANYSLPALTAATTASILKKDLAVTAQTLSKVYDGSTSSATTPDVDALETGDAIQTPAVQTFDTEHTGTHKVLTPSGLVINDGNNGGNYAITYIETNTGSITARSLTGSFIAANKEYDGLTSAQITARSLSGVLGSDAVSLSGGTAAFSNKNVGVAKTVTATGMTLTGTAATDYSLSSVNTATADITTKTLTVTITADSKTYDGTTFSNVHAALGTGFVPGDAVTPSATNGAFETKNVGTNKPVLADVSINGDDAGNYTANLSATANADITPLAITGAITASNKEYDATTAATIVTRTLTGIITGDAVTYTGGTAMFADKKVGLGKIVSANGLGLGGIDAANYTVNSSAATTANITAKAITVGISADTKVYDGNTAAIVHPAITSGLVTGDMVTPSATNGLFDTKHVGTAKPVSADISISGTDAENYSLTNYSAATNKTTATAAASITTRSINVTAQTDTRTYNGNITSVVMPVVDALQPGDAIQTSPKQTFNTKDVGTGKVLTPAAIGINDGNGGANYAVSYVPANTGSITALAITGSFSAANKVYDGTTAATVTNLFLSGVIGNDAVSLNGGAATFEDQNAGTGKVVTLTGTGLSGAGAGNYSLTSVANTTASITARPITLAADSKSKYCGQTDPALTYQISAGTLVGTDAVTGSLSRNSGESAGTMYTINQNTVTAGANYLITYSGASLKILGVTIDASASSNPVQLGSAALLKTSIIPAVAGVSVTFKVEGSVKGTGITDALGVASLSISNLGVNVYMVEAIAGTGCTSATAYFPVYDPTGGFVTGGGWITSPAGAVKANPTATGKATFGFVAKYKKGSSTLLEGETEFQFQAGNLKFNSSSYENMTLVIAGAKASYKGFGTINGTGNYKFMLTAIDGDLQSGGTDKIRMKITDVLGNTVYDNQIGNVVDNADPSSFLGGGSIVIHDSKKTTTLQSVTLNAAVSEVTEGKFGLTAFPNPSQQQFKIHVESSDRNQKITVRVYDAFGKTVRVIRNVTAGQTVAIGAELRPGVYYVEMTQGTQRVQTKLLKLVY